MTAAHRHPDFDNVIRVARFHQAPQRIQFLTDPGPNVIVLPVLRAPRRPRGPPSIRDPDPAVPALAEPPGD